MDKDSAKKLIQETLQSSFNKERFVYLVKNILNHIEDAPFVYKGNLIFDDFADSIQTVERIGKYKDPEDKLIDILIVRLQKKTSLERARTKQRNFVAKYLKGSRGGMLKDAALVAFVSPNGDDWRFSLVKMEYKFNEKGKVEEEFTPARRYSFLVGKNENSHTAQSRLLPLLLNDEINPSLKELEEVFSVEKVNKEFFEKYRDLFLWTKEELDKIFKVNPKVESEFTRKNIDTVVFVKKLLGQIVFLYFLQKRGWLGVKDQFGDGDRKFLRNLFEKAKKENKNFFNDYLKFLFYDALNNERRGSADPSYHPYFRCKIPFLNGGLFEPLGNYDWKNTDITLPAELFSNDFKTKQGDKGTGILDIFDRFNFTVKEDEPLDKEVAVDPELLGKLYEKFNAITSNNFSEYLKIIKKGKKGEETKFNKQYGVYYTPAEIVQYMCGESLINYLTSKFEGKIDRSDFEKLVNNADQILENEKTALIKEQEVKLGKIKKTDYKFKTPSSIRNYAKEIDEVLANIKICDPAVGSGAFPIGMMHQIVAIRELLSTLLKTNKNRYDLKLECIENSLYGVDIDPGAIEICKLRFWLSLVVDEERLEIKPLPNLDYKIMQGNSLISEFMGVNFDQEDSGKNGQIPILQDDTDDLIEKLKNKKDEYRNKTSASKKKQVKQEIEDLLIKIFETKLQKQKSDYFNRIKDIEKYYKVLPNKEQREKFIKQKKEKLFRDSGFNLEQFAKQLREYTTGNKVRPFFSWKLYFAEVFTGENPGFDVVIANPPYIQLQKAINNKQKYADLYKNEGYKTFDRTGDIYCLFYEKGIQLLKEKGILTYITSNKWMRAGYGEKLREFFVKHNPLQLVDLGPGVFENATVDTNILLIQKSDNQKNTKAITLQKEDKENISHALQQKGVLLTKLNKDAWFIGSNAEQRLKEKIERIGKPLKDWDVKIYRGVLTGLNEAFIITTEKRNEILANCKNEAERQRTEAIIKPILRGRDIKRYYYEWAGLWVIVIPAGWTDENRDKEKPEIFIEKTLAALMKYLKPFEAKAKKRDDQGNYWWEFRACAYYPEFEKEKVVWGNISYNSEFCFVDKGVYINAPANLITSVNTSIKFLVAVMNSKIFDWLFRQVGIFLGHAFEWKKQYVEQVKIPPITPTNEPIVRRIKELVDKILSAKKQNPQADTTAYEKQIDQLVYKLYGLMPEEIRIIENSQR